MFRVHLTGLCKATSKVDRQSAGEHGKSQKEGEREMSENEYDAFLGTNRYFQATAQNLSPFYLLRIESSESWL